MILVGIGAYIYPISLHPCIPGTPMTQVFEMEAANGIAGKLKRRMATK